MLALTSIKAKIPPHGPASLALFIGMTNVSEQGQWDLWWIHFSWTKESHVMAKRSYSFTMLPTGNTSTLSVNEYTCSPG